MPNAQPEHHAPSNAQVSDADPVLGGNVQSLDNGRRVVSTVDMCAFSSAIRGAATSQPLFHKTGVMRYDPLKKNVVRPFR